MVFVRFYLRSIFLSQVWLSEFLLCIFSEWTTLAKIKTLKFLFHYNHGVGGHQWMQSEI